MRGSLIGMAAAIATSIFANDVSAGTVLRSQAACSDGSSCVFIQGPEDRSNTLRSFEFTLPRGGDARIRFEGSMLCTVQSGLSGVRVVDLSAQIVTRSDTQPDGSKEGGLRIARTYVSNPSRSITDTFNLSTSRPLGFVSGGPSRMFFNIDIHRFDAGIRCDFFNDSFSVLLMDLVPTKR